MSNFVLSLLAALVVVALAVLLLGVRMLLRRGGEFPQTHIHDNQALKKKGIGCARLQMEKEAFAPNLKERVQQPI